MAALWREHGKMMKFGTLIGMVINSDLTNFGVSRTTSIAPPPVQNSTFKWYNSWTLNSRKMKLSTPDYSSCWSHAIAYSKTPPITVAAILKSTVFSLIATPPWKLIQFFPKMAQMIFGPSRIEMTEQIFFNYLCSKVDVMNLMRFTQYWFRDCISAKLYQSKRNLVCFINTKIWGPMPKLGIAPPMGCEIPKMLIFAYNFWIVNQKIMNLRSMDSLGHAKSDGVNYARIGWTKWPLLWN